MAALVSPVTSVAPAPAPQGRRRGTANNVSVATLTPHAPRAEQAGSRRRILGASVAVSLLLIASTAGVVHALVAKSDGPNEPSRAGAKADAVRHLHKTGSVNVAALSAMPASEHNTPRYARIPEHDAAVEHDIAPNALKTPVAAIPSPVQGGGGNGAGFDGINITKMEHAGNGDYADSNGGLEPPDQALCVGNGFVMEGVNQAWQIFKTTGEPATNPVTLTEFFGLPVNGTVVDGAFVSDPRCVYDPDSRRFIAVILEADTSNFATTLPFLRAHNYYAVSDTSDPTGHWSIYSMDVTDDGALGTPAHTSCPCIGDQPLLGVDAHGVYLTTNEFSDSEIFPVAVPGQVYTAISTLPDYRNGQAQVYAVPKDDLLRGENPNVVSFDTADIAVPPADQGKTTSLWYSLEPAAQPPGDLSSLPKSGVEYFVSSLDFQGQGDHRIAVWALTNTSALGSLPESVHLVNRVVDTPGGERYQSPLFGVDQKDGPHPLGDQCSCPLEQLNANDDRMGEVMLTNGSLWSGLNTALPPADPSATEGPDSHKRAGIMYFQVQPGFDETGTLTADIARDGYIEVAKNSVLFPSIAASPAGPVAAFFTLTGVDYYPSAAWARLDGLGPNEAPVVHVSGAGSGPEDGFTGYPTTNQVGAPTVVDDSTGVSRWGDYGFAEVDESGCLWGASEYIPPVLDGRDAAAGNWGSFITRVKPTGCDEPDLVVSSATPAPPRVNPCGPLFTDPAADDDAGAVEGRTTPDQGKTPQLDILSGSMSLSADGSTLTTTIVLRDIEANTFAPGSVGSEYYMYWNADGVNYFTNVHIDPTGVTYTDGTVTGAVVGARKARTTGPAATGAVVYGANGTVSVSVPISALHLQTGSVLNAPYAETRASDTVAGRGLVPLYDAASPDYAYQIGEVCPAG